MEITTLKLCYDTVQCYDTILQQTKMIKILLFKRIRNVSRMLFSN